MMKKATAILTVLGVCSVMAAGAYAAEPTAEEIMSQYAAASSETTEFNCTTEIKADVTIELPDMDTTFGLNADGGMTMEVSLDPLAMHISGNINYNAMGEGDAVDMEMYFVPDEDGTLGGYVNMTMGEEATGWQYQGVDSESAAQLYEAMEKAKSFDMSSLPISFDLADDTLDVEGHTCYRLVSNITWQDIMNLLPALMEAAGEAGEALPDLEELSQVGAIFDGLVINAEIDVDTESYLPIHAHIDTEGSDWTAIAAVFASYAGLTNEDGSLMNVSISVNDLYFDFLYDYDTPIEIVVPEEALASKDAGNVISVDDLEEMLETELG